MFHHRFSHLFHFRPLHYGDTKKLGANQVQIQIGFSNRLFLVLWDDENFYRAVDLASSSDRKRFVNVLQRKAVRN